jgi:hypothetical protein
MYGTLQLQTKTKYNMYWNLQLCESIHMHHPTVMLSVMRYYQKPSRTQQDQF